MAEEEALDSLQKSEKEADSELSTDFLISENKESESTKFQVEEKKENDSASFQMKKEENESIHFQNTEKKENGSANFQVKEAEENEARNLERNEKEVDGSVSSEMEEEEESTNLQESEKEENGLANFQLRQEEEERTSENFEENNKETEKECLYFQKNGKGLEEVTNFRVNEKEIEEISTVFQSITKEEDEVSMNFQEKEREPEKSSSSQIIEQEGDEKSTTIQTNDNEAEKWIQHYCSKHHILLVGEGDFSFAACLARAFGDATNMIATSRDSAEMLKSKHKTAEQNLHFLEKLGCMILHGVNAHTMTEHSVLKNKKFDRIVFNFPHAGFLYREHDDWQISLHRKLVEGFFKSARRMLRKKGEVHVTHKTAYPFNKWEVDKLGEEHGLVLIQRARFCKWDYPGYDNKRGDGERSNKTFPVGTCDTFKFQLG